MTALISFKMIKKDYTDFFETTVLNNLLSLNLSKENIAKMNIGIGVSGGADSISLLISLYNLSKKYAFKLFCVTVNHNMREALVSLKDSEYVLQLCNSLGVFCKKIDIPEGKIFNYCSDNKCSTEEAARILRYEIFDSFIQENKIDYFCLAHNKNDQLETVLMRFLQGAGTAGISGIKTQRNKYVRPLLNLTRKQIEEYLLQKKVGWKNDETNLDEHYLRNRIRHSLIPLLNEKFDGWDTGCLKICEKSSWDEEYFSSILEKLNWTIEKPGEIITYPSKDLGKMQKSILLRFLQKGFNILGVNKRIPFSFLNEFITVYQKKQNEKNGDFEVQFDEFNVSYNTSTISIKKSKILATESSFFVIIKEDGRFTLPFGEVIVKQEESNIIADFKGLDNSIRLQNLSFPLCIRSRQPDDYVLTGQNDYKSVSDILSDWHVIVEDKQRIPIVQSLHETDQSLIAVLGSLIGYKDWILRGY